jgi:hypothetical protein
MPEDMDATNILHQLSLVSDLSDQQLQQAQNNPQLGWMAGIVAANRAEMRAPNPPMPQGTVIGQKLAQLQGGIPAGMPPQQMAQANPMAMGIAAAPENVPGAATGGIIALAHGGLVPGYNGTRGSSVGSYDPVTGEWRKHPYHESARAESDPTGQYITDEDIEAGRKHESVKPRYKTAPADVKDIYGLQGMTPEEAAAEIERLNLGEKISKTQEGIPEELQRLNEASQLERGGYNKLRATVDPAEMERLTPNTKGPSYESLQAGFPPEEAAYPLEQAKINPTPLMKEKAAKVPTPKIDEAIETAKGKKGKKAKAAPPSGNVEKAPEPAPTPAAEPAAPEAPLGKTREQALAEFEAGQQAAPVEGPPKPSLGARTGQALDAAKTAGVKALSGNTGAFLKGAGTAGTAFDVANAADVFMDPSMSAGEKGKAVTQLSGRLGGAATGAALGLYGGPFAPITVPVGAGIGYFAGGKGADYLAEKAGLPEGDPTEYSYGPFGQFKEKVAGALAGQGSLDDEDRVITQEEWQRRRAAHQAPAHDTSHGDKPGQVKADPNAPGFKPTPKVQAHPEAATTPAQPATPAGGMTVSAPGGITSAGARPPVTPGGIAGSPTSDQELGWYKHMLGDSAYRAPEALNAEWEKQKENLARDKWGLAAVRGIAGMISAPTEHWGKALGIGLGEAASQYAAGARQEEDLAEKSLARAEANSRADYDFNREAAKLYMAERAAKARDDADLRRALAVARVGYDTAIAKQDYKAEMGGMMDKKAAYAQASKDWNAAVLQDPKLQEADSTAWIDARARQLMNTYSAAPQAQGGPATGAKYIFDPNMGVRTAG